MYPQLLSILGLVALTLAQAPSPSAVNPLVSVIRSGIRSPASSAPPATSPDPVPAAPAVNPLVSVIHSGIRNPLVSLIQSGIRDPAFTPNPVVSLIQSGMQNPAFTTTTYTQEPASFAPSNIAFSTTLVFAPQPSPIPASPPTAPDATPGEVRFCTSTTYTAATGDAPDAVCDAVHAPLNTCRNLSAALRKKVLSVTPDKAQLCLLFADDDCYGAAEWVKWPGVRNLRGRLGEGGDWARRVVSFRCTRED